jgi:hypothetical protein
LFVVNVEGVCIGEAPIVLLVDDHEDSAAMYAISLLAMGFQIHDVLQQREAAR